MGATVKERMANRSYTWAIGKWEVHRQAAADDMRDAFEELQRKCQDPEAVLPHISVCHLRNVLEACPKTAGLGCDMWPLFLWSKLPDEAFRGLQLIIKIILRCKMILQALLSLIAFMDKTGGGERPIGLVAMLYRLVMRLYKGIIGHWDQKFHGFWDQAVKNSSCLRAAVLRALRVEVGVWEGV